jgi:energy-coupling factor transporter transmembrane protein EcfT
VARLGLASSLDPKCRLICLALVSSASFFSGALFAFFLAIAAILLLLGEGLRFAAILRDSTFIAVFSIFTSALRFIGPPQSSGPGLLEYMTAYGLRLLAVFLAGRLFYASTTASEIRDAVTRIARYLPVIRRFDIGLYLSMVIGFIPFIFEEWRNSLEAARSRGMPRRPRLSRISLLMTAFLRRLLLRAIAMPEALVARGWTRERGLAPSRWRMRDSITSLVCGILVIIATLHVV